MKTTSKGKSVIKRLASLRSLKGVTDLYNRVYAGEFPCATGKTQRRRNKAFSAAFAKYGRKMVGGGQLAEIA